MQALASSLWHKMCTYDFLTNMASHTDAYTLFSVHCKHVQCKTLTHSTNKDLLNIKRKGDPIFRTLSRT